MADARQAYAELFKLATDSSEAQRVKEAALWPWLAGGGALAAGVGIPLAYRAGQRSKEEEASRNQLLTFGGGALAGALAPTLLKKLRGALGGGGTGLLGGGTYDQFTEF